MNKSSPRADLDLNRSPLLGCKRRKELPQLNSLPDLDSGPFLYKTTEQYRITYRDVKLSLNNLFQQIITRYLLNSVIVMYAIILSLVVLSTLGTIYLLKLLTFPHWESLSAAYKELISQNIWLTMMIRAVDSAPWGLSVRAWQIVIVYCICMLCVHVCQC